jgi:hypothetical protein
MHTPYIRPSENGSRGGVYWVQLNDGYWAQKQVSDSHNAQAVFRTAVPKLWESIDEDGSFDEGTAHLPTGCSMTVRCSKLFNFSVQEFTPEALSATTHSSGLFRRALVCKSGNMHGAQSDPTQQDGKNAVVKGMYLNIDPYLMGVGGDDSWSACVHEGYLLPPAVYNFKVSLTFHNPEDQWTA